MKNPNIRKWFSSALCLIAFQTIGYSQIQNPDSATVTFKVNTAFVQDTVTHCSGVFITGGNLLGDWSLPNGIKLKSAGGDYWEGSKTFKTGSTIGTFKPVTQTMSGIGWDRHEYSGFTVLEDTTITIFATGLKEKYTDPVTGSLITRGDDWNPLNLEKAKEEGKIAVLFRVNMQSEWSFNPAFHKVQVRGAFNEWSGSTELYPEVRHDDLASSVYQAEKYFFSRIVLIDESFKNSTLKYKFTFTNPAVQWESINDRDFILNKDTTLFWKGFNDPYLFQGSCSNEVINREGYKVHFKVDMDKAIKTTGFDPITDTLYVKAGLGGTSVAVVDIKLNHESGTLYSGDSGTDSLFLGYNPMKGKETEYKNVFYGYYKRNTKGEFEEFYFDIYDSTAKPNGPKFRKMTLPVSGKDIFAEDLETDQFSTHRQPIFKNYTPMADSTRVNFEVDFTPLFYFVNELGDSLTGGWTTGDPLYVSSKNILSLPFELIIRKYCDVCIGLPISPVGLKDDGTGLDRVAGDRIYSGSITATQAWNYGFNCTVFIAGLDLESNANDHLVNLYPQPENNISLVFGKTDPLRYRNEKGYWDFNSQKGVVTSVHDFPDSEQPKRFNLSAYPNPFNPATLISYSIPQSGKVSLKVFDLLGRQVAILAEEIKPAGTHQIPFRGDDLSSGIYIVRMGSGTKSESVKVILLK